MLNLKNKKRMDRNFHRRLEQYFLDYNRRMAYQQRQENLYESVIKKKRAIKKLRIQEIFSLYTEEELNALSYFQRTSFFYLKYQDPEVKLNIFDRRQSFLLKMHDLILLENSLNSSNRRND